MADSVVESAGAVRPQADKVRTMYVAAQFATDGPNGKDGALLAAETVRALYETADQPYMIIHRDGVVYLGFVGK